MRPPILASAAVAALLAFQSAKAAADAEAAFATVESVIVTGASEAGRTTARGRT